MVPGLPGPIIVKNICHGGWTPTTSPPTLSDPPIDVSFPSSARMSVSTDGGLSFFDVFLDGPTTVHVSASQDSPSSSYFETEMIQLDLQSTASPVFGPVKIRESPTLQSLGKIRESPSLPSRGGSASGRIGSFFDVFPEISLDDGATWTPASSAVTVT